MSMPLTEAMGTPLSQAKQSTNDNSTALHYVNHGMLRPTCSRAANDSSAVTDIGRTATLLHEQQQYCSHILTTMSTA